MSLYETLLEIECCRIEEKEEMKTHKKKTYYAIRFIYCKLEYFFFFFVEGENAFDFDQNPDYSDVIFFKETENAI